LSAMGSAMLMLFSSGLSVLRDLGLVNPLL
jgi:hypothetical protein